jgi:hypothetical protein
MDTVDVLFLKKKKNNKRWRVEGGGWRVEGCF